MKIKKCQICGSSDFEEIKKENNFKLLRCLRCGLVFLGDLPSEARLDGFYNVFFNENDEKLWQRFNEKIFKLAKKRILRRKNKGSLLDIGCGYGFFLKLMKEERFDVYGVEMANKPSEFAKKNLKLKVINLDFNEISMTRKFDVVTLWWFLEHVPDPKKTLIKVRKLLKNDGILFLRVPNIDFILFVNKFSFLEPFFNRMLNPVSGKNHFFEVLGAPHHLFGFNPGNLTMLLRQIGFKKIKIYLEGSIKTGVTSRDFFEKILYNFNFLVMFLTRGRIIFYHDFMIEARVGKEGK